MTMTIRTEELRDRQYTENLVREAFWNLYQPGATEHLALHQLRSSEDFLPDLCLVLEDEGEVRGMIAYSRTLVSYDGLEEIAVISFGPVAISPAHQGKGYGRQLIEASLEKARDLGHQAVIIGGYPDYYRKYGFEPSKAYGLAMPDGQFYTGIQVKLLGDSPFLKGKIGQVYFSPFFDVYEEELELFDKAFQPKEKAVTPSQADFAVAVSEIDTNNYA